MTIADDIPDSRTVWDFKEKMTDLGLVESLFALFLKELERLNLIVNEGKIIDASFVEVPRQPLLCKIKKNDYFSQKEKWK